MLIPRPVASLADLGRRVIVDVAGILPRTTMLLTQAEFLIIRVNQLVDSIEVTRSAADAEILRIDATNTQADALVIRGAGLVASIEPTIDRGLRMFDEFAPILDRLKPIADRLSRTIDPDEVEAIVQLLDHLPDLVDRIETDVLPMMVTLRSVGPDVHDLLDITRELNAMLGKLPGMGRVRKRIDEQQEIDAAQDGAQR